MTDALDGKPVSAWLAEAAAEKGRAADLQAAGQPAARELAAEYESEHGPLPAPSRQRAREFLAEAGLLDDAPQQVARLKARPGSPAAAQSRD